MHITDNLKILLKELIKELIWRFQNPKDLTIFCLVISLVVFLITYTNPIVQGDNVVSFLSSVSQGLAAIFALEFAIIIFGAEMAKNYISLNKIFDKWTIILMLVFIVGIILPLIQLIADYNFLPFDRILNLSLAFDLFLATFCVSSIVPYLIRVNRIMKYEGGISNIIQEASEAIDSNYKITASNKIIELIEIGKDCIHNKYWDKTYTVVEKLEFLGIQTVDKKWIDLALSNVNGLTEICTKICEKGKHVDAIFNKQSKDGKLEEYIKVIVRATKSLGAIGLRSVEKQLDGVPLYFGRSLQNDMFTSPLIVDPEGAYSHLDYDSACSYLGIKNVTPNFCRIIDFFELRNFHIDALKAILYTKLGDYGSFWGDNDFNIIGINKKLTDERNLKDLEHCGIERFHSLPQEVMMKLLEIGTEASIGTRESFKSQYAQGLAIASSTLSEVASIGINAIRKNLSDGTVSMSSYCIYQIGIVSIEDGFDFVDTKDSLNMVNEFRRGLMLLPYAVELLGEIANIAYIEDPEKFKNSYESSLAFLWILGVYSSRYLPNYAKEMASELKNSDKRVIKDEFGSEYIREEIREYFKDTICVEYLKSFEELYDKQ